jgi:hypothetical protein
MAPNVNLDRSFALHCRSLDRINGDSSDYDIYLKTPIECPSNSYLMATLTRADVPNSFYTIDKNHNTITFDCLPEIGSHMKSKHSYILDNAYFTEVTQALFRQTITLHSGNYSIGDLLAEIISKISLNNVRTYLRGKLAGQGGTAAEQEMNTADRATVEGLTINTDFFGFDYVESTPTFTGSYDEIRNKLLFQRSDNNVCNLPLAQFTITANGNRLLMALGFDHYTAQTVLQFKKEGQQSKEKTMIFSHNTTTLDATELNGFSTTVTQTIFPPNIVNVHAEDTVYLRCPDLGTNGYETLYGNMTNVLGVIPMTGQGHALVFHNPVIPFPVNVKTRMVDHLHISLTDARGEKLNFNGAENELSITFECFLKGSRPFNKGLPDADMDVQQTHKNDPYKTANRTASKMPPTKHQLSSKPMMVLPGKYTS